MKNKLALIEWIDAFHPYHCKWTDEEGLNDFIQVDEFKCQNVGWIVHKDKTHTTVASMAAHELSQFSHIQRIPNGCIQKITYLK